MKIAFFTDCYLDLTGGIVTDINMEKAELERRGHTVYVFSSAYPRDISELEQLAKKSIYPVPCCRHFGRGLTPIARRPGIIQAWLKRNFPELKDFDVFYIHYEAGCSIAGLRLAKELGISSIQVMHGREDMGEAKLIPFGFRTFVAIMLNWFHSWYLPHPVIVKRDNYLANTIAKAKMWTLMVNHANFADLVITPSEHFRKKLVHYGVTRKVIALHHGLNNELLKNNVSPKTLKPNEPLRIVWHSRVSGEKRIMPFLEALTMVKGDYHLTVYGDGAELGKARRYARRHDIDATFHGSSDFGAIKKHLLSSHLDALVSYNYDTFGMTLIEAKAFGVPAFIVDPDLAEVLAPGEYILASDPSPKQMAKAITKIIDSPNIINEISKKMLSEHQSISITRKIDTLEDIIKNLKAKS